MNARRFTIAACTLAVVVLSVTGCTVPSTRHLDTAPTQAPSTQPASTAAPHPTVNLHGYAPTTRTAAPQPAGGGAQADGDTVQTTQKPSPSGRAAASDVAVTFVRAFTRKDLPEAAWTAGYKGFLTPYSQTAYQGTAENGVPGTTVTGSGSIEAGATATTATVDVPTDAGKYRVQLLRTTATSTWLVNRAILPAEATP